MSFHGTSDIFRKDFAWLRKTANVQCPFDCYECLVGKDEEGRKKEKKEQGRKRKEKGNRKEEREMHLSFFSFYVHLRSSVQLKKIFQLF